MDTQTTQGVQVTVTNNYLPDYSSPGQQHFVFAYKINIGAGVFIIAIVASVLIAWITVGYKAFRAAMANPVKSLRSE